MYIFIPQGGVVRLFGSAEPEKNASFVYCLVNVNHGAASKCDEGDTAASESNVVGQVSRSAGGLGRCRNPVSPFQFHRNHCVLLISAPPFDSSVRITRVPFTPAVFGPVEPNPAAVPPDVISCFGSGRRS